MNCRSDKQDLHSLIHPSLALFFVASNKHCRKSAWANARESLHALNLTNDDTDDAASAVTDTENVIDLTKRHPLTGSLNFSERLKLMSLLEQWEEPVRRQEGKVRTYL
jgi:hypothetical protein